MNITFFSIKLNTVLLFVKLINQASSKENKIVGAQCIAPDSCSDMPCHDEYRFSPSSQPSPIKGEVAIRSMRKCSFMSRHPESVLLCGSEDFIFS